MTPRRPAAQRPCWSSSVDAAPTPQPLHRSAPLAQTLPQLESMRKQSSSERGGTWIPYDIANRSSAAASRPLLHLPCRVAARPGPGGPGKKGRGQATRRSTRAAAWRRRPHLFSSRRDTDSPPGSARCSGTPASRSGASRIAAAAAPPPPPRRDYSQTLATLATLATHRSPAKTGSPTQSLLKSSDHSPDSKRESAGSFRPLG